MKKLLIVVLCFMSSIAFSDSAKLNIDDKNVLAQKEQCQLSTEISKEQSAQRGCCSWHQGVCGCQFGRVVCCDGSYSPTCLCNKEEAPVVSN